MAHVETVYEKSSVGDFTVSRTYSREILSEKPEKCNTTDGRWSVRVKDTYDGGMTIEHGVHFRRKKTALAWLAQYNLPKGEKE